MAYNESGNLSPSQDYTLGNYTFQLRSNYDGDEDVTGIVARMTINGQTSVKGIDIDGQATVESWSVEANESEATVYAIYGKRETTVREVNLSQVNSMSYSYSAGVYWPNIAVWADFPAKVSFDQQALNAQTQSPITLTYYAAKDIYIGDIDINGNSQTPDYGPVSTEFPPYDLYPQGHASEQHEYEELVARFSIDIYDAGGTDPEEWDEPIDYEEGWEEGDPTHTLQVTIKGATSGRHNDPLNDPSYSYLPADNTTVKPYGSGGDGGFGGGGGAGASTVIVYKFATNRANSKEVTAIARGHGYGSGGGKGGKGGDGCIIVYY